MTTMNDMELNHVSGGAELSEPFKKLMEYLDNYDVTKDPFYFPDHKLPWEMERPDWLNDQLILAPDLVKVA